MCNGHWGGLWVSEADKALNSKGRSSSKGAKEGIGDWALRTGEGGGSCWASVAGKALNAEDAEGAEGTEELEESGHSMGGKGQERGADGLRALRSLGGGGGSGEVAEWRSDGRGNVRQRFGFVVRVARGGWGWFLDDLGVIPRSRFGFVCGEGRWR